MKFNQIISFFLFSSILFAMDVREVGENNPDRAAQLIYEVRLTIPYGRSEWTGGFTPRGSSPIKILLLAESSCSRGPNMNVAVHHSPENVWEATQYQNTFDYYSGGLIDGIHFVMEQKIALKLTCTFRIYAEQGVSNPVSPKESLVGALDYKGGFSEANLLLNPSRYVTQFRVQVPSYCANVQVLEASTTTEGVQDTATWIDKKNNIFSINGGAGMRISNIKVHLNGPAGAACSLPVYIVEK